MHIFTVVGVTVGVTMLVVFLRTTRPELALGLSVVGGAIILIYIFKDVSPLISQLKAIMQSSNIDYEYIKLLLKSLGICYIAGFTADTCNDFGQTSLASKVELCGKISLAAISIPLCIKIINMITKIVG